MADFDVVMIGAGHNALVCAGYLAQAGYKVGVFERRGIVGGAVVTEEIVPGYKFDLGGSAHLLINHTSIVEDLHLADYGLDYIDIDPLFWAPFPDGSHITIWRDAQQTCESIATVSPEDADAYWQFHHKWLPLAEGMVAAFNQPPTVGNLVRNMGINTGPVDAWPKRLKSLLSGYGPVLRETFKSHKVQALMGWMAAQSGPPPGELLSGPFVLWHPMYHVGGMRRPRGGSGQLTQALARMIQAHGGTIHLNSSIDQILVENGRAVGVQLFSGEQVTGKLVVSGAHAHTTAKMLAGSAAKQGQRLAGGRIGNGFGMVVRYAMDELPNYTALPTAPDGQPGYQHRAMQFICPDLDYLERAYADYKQGRPSENPALISMTWSAIDDTLAPAGKHVMFVWAQYAPYELASGALWDDIAPQVAERQLDVLAAYAPNVKGAVIDGLIEHPVYLERTLGLLRGNVMHLEMSVDQMFVNRPAIGLSTYKGPVKGLYLTGASTHPGGGIMGAAGRNTALVVLAELEKAVLKQPRIKTALAT